jgi:hypothetical protein
MALNVEKADLAAGIADLIGDPLLVSLGSMQKRTEIDYRYFRQINRFGGNEIICTFGTATHNSGLHAPRAG